MPALGQWPALTRARRRNELMDRMMRQLGVDVLIAVGLERGQAFVAARSKCRRCPHENECRFWLAAAARAPLPPDFCPNANFFRKCGLLGAHGLWRERHSRLPVTRSEAE